jgi:hypothetical protein
MLHLFDAYASLFKSWQIVRYEQEGQTYMLHITAILTDDSRLELRDYLFVDGSRKYAYHWMEPDNRLRRRWDNAPHWPDLSTAPFHVHRPEQPFPEPSTITNLEELLAFIQRWLNPSHH